MNMQGVLLTMAVSLLLTEAVELPLAALIGARRRENLLLVFLANLMTNPAVVYIYIVVRLSTGRSSAESVLPFLEAAAVLAEAALYAGTPGMLRPENLFFRGSRNQRTAGLTDSPAAEEERRAPRDKNNSPSEKVLTVSRTASDKDRRLRRIRWAAALLLSVLLNAASFAAGVLADFLLL